MNAPVRHDSIGQLCIALAHRWEPERLFVIFTTYFDEADTHGPSPTVIIGGFVGHAYQWRRFETHLVRLQKKHGFKVFHAKDFKARRREFEGWSDDQCQSLIHDLANLVRHDLTEGLTIFLERERYEQEYRAPPIPRRMNLDSQLGVCFRGCLGRLLYLMEQRGNRDTLHVVMEDGHPNVWDCGRIFVDLRRRFEKLGSNVLGDFTVKDKESCPPLMVADMLAATHSMTRAATQRGEFDPSEMAPIPPGYRRGHLAFLELAGDALRGLKEGFEELRQTEIEQWRAARDARLSPSSPKRRA